MKHTPGPWRWEQFADDGRRRVNWQTCFLHSDSRNETVLFHDACWAPKKADRDIIAAAPELFEALERFVRAYSTGQREKLDRAGELARAALAKAKGGGL